MKPDAPGLGIELDDHALADKHFEGDWQTPTFWLEDGSLTEW